jgi:hypothetical protein
MLVKLSYGSSAGRRAITDKFAGNEICEPNAPRIAQDSTSSISIRVGTSFAPVSQQFLLLD